MKKTLPALAVAAIAVFGLSACTINVPTPTEQKTKSSSTKSSAEEETPASAEETPASTGKNKESTVVYEVSSDASTASSITYMTFDDGGSGQEMATDAAVPFAKEISVTRGGTFNPQMFTLSAMASQDASTISCKITLDGEVIAEQTSSGPFSMVSCMKM